MSLVSRHVLVCVALMVVGSPAALARSVHKEQAPAKSDATSAPEAEPVPKQRTGPDKVAIGHALTVNLPEGYLLLEKPEAEKMMEQMGNLHNDTLLALIGKPHATWVVVVRYDEEGYVKDDEAGKLDADAILKTIREGTDAANEERTKRGFEEIHVDGWTEPPHYDRASHHLIWGVKGSSKSGASINYNTRVLGRKGYASLNLIDSPEGIEQAKPEVARLLAATTFDGGSRYGDFDSKKDKVAEYGLAALVAGGAGAAAIKLVKVGLLAKFGGKLIALLIAAKKLIVVGALGFWAFIRRLFGRKKSEPVATPTTSAAPPPPEPPLNPPLDSPPTAG